MKNVTIVSALILLLSVPAFAQQSEIFQTSEGAIRGYDPVAFFNEGKALSGSKEFYYDWKGARWFFVSTDHLEMFKKDPERFAPQYGGYCAFGMADGHKAPTETDTWTIHNEKLYFNYNQKVKSTWTKNMSTLITKADKNWPLLKDKE